MRQTLQVLSHDIANYYRREKYNQELLEREDRWGKLFDKKNSGYLKVFQPILAYFGAISTCLIVCLFNTVSLWNGQHLSLKAISAFVSVSPD